MHHMSWIVYLLFGMKKRFRLALIIICVLVLVGLRIFSPEDNRVCDGDTLVKHGTPSSDSSGFFCSWGMLMDTTLLSSSILAMKIITDFTDNGLIPSQYTCDGEGRFPTLTIEDIPANTQSLALIVDDPDVPGWTRDHLLLANIPVEGVRWIISSATFATAIVWQNSRWELARWGPCPPHGTHRYFFKVYALSTYLELSSGFSKERLYELMSGKINAQAQLVGLYKRQ